MPGGKWVAQNPGFKSPLSRRGPSLNVRDSVRACVALVDGEQRHALMIGRQRQLFPGFVVIDRHEVHSHNLALCDLIWLIGVVEHGEGFQRASGRIADIALLREHLRHVFVIEGNA